jgi:hypothetical protein
MYCKVAVKIRRQYFCYAISFTLYVAQHMYVGETVPVENRAGQSHTGGTSTDEKVPQSTQQSTSCSK